MHWLTDPNAWVGLLTLTALDVVLGHGVSGRDLILIVGGLFLIGKATFEIHGKLEGEEHGDGEAVRAARSLARGVVQIMLVDIVFSLDSVITAVGMVDEVSLMIVANMLALGVMLAAAGAISSFVDRHPTVKMLALSFLVLIGTNLVAEGFGVHIPKGYTYFAMGLAVVVEMRNLSVRLNAGRAAGLGERAFEPLVTE